MQIIFFINLKYIIQILINNTYQIINIILFMHYVSCLLEKLSKSS
jgi:hypothetical protein